MTRLIWPLFTLSITFTSSSALAFSSFGIGEPNGSCIIKTAAFDSKSSIYQFSGECTLRHTRLKLLTTAPWTATGTFDPKTTSTSEDIVVPAARIDQPSRPYGRFQAKMHCPSDPWLTQNIACNGIVPTIDAPLDQTAPNAVGWQQSEPLAPKIRDVLVYNRRPFTAVLSDDMRRALNKQHSNPLGLQTKVNPMVVQPNSPIIISPQPNTRVTSNAFKIQIVPSKMLTGTHILVQFTKVDGPANQLKPTYSWLRPTGELASGAYLPTDLVNSKGNWKIRARIDAPKPGDFSAEVPFTYAPAIATKPRTGFDIYKR